jgi:hypothetical protein
MRRTALVVLLAVTLSACSSSGGKGSASSSTTVSDSSAAPTAIPSDQRPSIYLQVIRDYLPGKSDDELLALGHGICREFDDGKTWTDVIEGFINGGTAAKTSGAVVAVAVGALCPEHKADLPAS